MDGSDYTLIAVAGLLSGAINALAGGGSLVLFPALVACGLPPLAANVTNSMANLPGYAGGVLGYRPDLKGQRARIFGIVGVTVLGAALGCALLLRLPDRAFNLIVPILVLFASVLLAVQPAIQRRAGTAGRERIWQRQLALGLAAAYGGYFGGALGVILLATLALTVPDDLRRLNALKSVISLVNGTVCAVIFALFAPVHWPAAALAAPTNLLGGYLGARLASRVNERWLRRGIVVYGVGVAAYLAMR